MRLIGNSMIMLVLVLGCVFALAIIQVAIFGTGNERDYLFGALMGMSIPYLRNLSDRLCPVE